MELFFVKYLDKLGRFQENYLTGKDLINCSSWTQKMINFLAKKEQLDFTDLRNRYSIEDIFSTREVKPGDYEKTADSYYKASLMLDEFPFDDRLFKDGRTSFDDPYSLSDAKDILEVIIQQLQDALKEISCQEEFLEVEELIIIRN